MKRLQKATLICTMLDRMIEKGSWAGETHLQKCLFLLQSMRNVPTGYTFQLHHYGPFSFDLSDEIIQLKGDRIIVPRPRPYPYGPSLASSDLSQRLRQNFSKTLEKYSDDIDFVTDNFGDLNASELGKLATAYHFILQDKNSSDEEIAKKINDVKSHILISEGMEATKTVRTIANSTGVPIGITRSL